MGSGIEYSNLLESNTHTHVINPRVTDKWTIAFYPCRIKPFNDGFDPNGDRRSFKIDLERPEKEKR